MEKLLALASCAISYLVCHPPPGEVGCQFTTVMSAEWQGVINQN